MEQEAKATEVQAFEAYQGEYDDIIIWIPHVSG